jgi:biopolymer transport protein TolR
MGRQTTLTSLKEISEINLTPLMDLTFILLIAFIITYPLIEQGVPVNLPKGTGDNLDSEEARTVSIDKNGKLYLDDLPIDQQTLAREMVELGQSSPDITVFVRADQDILYGKVIDIMNILKGAKIAKMALITEAAE